MSAAIQRAIHHRLADDQRRRWLWAFGAAIPLLGLPVLAAHAISRALAAAELECPVLCASGLSSATVPLALAACAAGVGVGSAVNRLSDELAMVAVVRGLREAIAPVVSAVAGAV